MSVKLLMGDCRYMPLAAKSFTAIVTDPPYNIGIPYHLHFDNMPTAAYNAWCGEWLYKCWNWLKDDGSLWIVINWPNYPAIYDAALRMGFHYRNTILWVETFSQYSEYNYTQVCRPILYVTKHSREYKWRPLRTTSTRQLMGDKRANPDGKVLDTLWVVPRVCGTFKERVEGVPTQLPIELCKSMIESCTDVGDDVLDPFAGSGSVGVACQGLNRSFTGIEIDPYYYQIASQRLTLTGSP